LIYCTTAAWIRAYEDILYFPLLVASLFPNDCVFIQKYTNAL